MWKSRSFRQSLLSNKLKNLLCILLSDFTPKVALIQREAIPNTICINMTTAKSVKAVVSDSDVFALVAISTANLVDHTKSKSAPTMKIPRSVLSTA